MRNTHTNRAKHPPETGQHPSGAKYLSGAGQVKHPAGRLTAVLLMALLLLMVPSAVASMSMRSEEGTSAVLPGQILESAPETYVEPVPETYDTPIPETYHDPIPETYHDPVPETYHDPVPETYDQPYDVPAHVADEPTPVTDEPVPVADELSPAQRILQSMILREKIYQLFIVEPSDITGVENVTVAGERTRQGLERYPVGGLIYDRSNMRTQEQVRDMLVNIQTLTKIPLFLTCDEEGGRVNRLMGAVGTPYVGPMLRYRAQGAAKAYENAQTIANGLKICAFNMDFAPVADVWSNPANSVIGDRAYSTDYTEAAELVSAAVNGFHDAGIICTLKHFPGHGDTSEDSHTGTAYVRKTLDELRTEEWLPFRAGIEAGADMVMVGHLTAGEIDREPAPFSHRIVTELLRGELGFDGVIITDGLQMQAMTDHYTSGEIAVKAIDAGVDMLLCPEDLGEAARALWDAVETGEIPETRLDESVLRILTLKQAYGLLENG